MQAVILAAGLGTRMGDLTKDRPKPLLTIQNRTLLEHNLLALPSEIDEIVLVVGHLAEQIKSFIKDDFLGRPVRYVHQNDLKGTAHALSLCKDILKGRFLVLMGDDLYRREDLTELVKHPLAMLVTELKEDDDRSYAAKVLTGGNNELVDIIERQPAKKGSLINCGAYVIEDGFFSLPLVPAGIPANEYGLPQTFLQMVKVGQKIDIVKATWWHKVAGPEDLKISNRA